MFNGAQINKDNPLLLASASPRRKAILRQIGIPFEAKKSMFDEAFYKDLHPEEKACQAAISKSKSVYEAQKKQWILGADTIVVIDKTIFGKPKNLNDCRDTLNQLKGKSHKTITGFCLLNLSGEIAHLEAVITEVKIKKLSDSEIENYIKTGEPFGKAGSYAIQGIGSFMIEYIHGSYTNVVGLPAFEVVKAFVKCGAIKDFPLTEKDSIG
jgi:septum formation protein